MRLWQKVLFGFLFVWGFVIPAILLVVTNRNELDNSGHLPVAARAQVVPENAARQQQPPHERKILDYNPEIHLGQEEMQYQVKELGNIVQSVRNELRNLEQERGRLHHEIDASRFSLGKVKRQVSDTKAELQDTKSKLAKTLREMKRANQRNYADPSKSSVVLVNVQVPNAIAGDYNLPADKDGHDQGAVQELRAAARRKPDVPCSPSHCLDQSKCPLTKPFGAFVVNLHHKDLLELEDPEMITTLRETLRVTGSLVDQVDQACAFFTIVGPLRERLDEASLRKKLESLPYWNGGSNHVLINLPSSNETAGVNQETLALGRAVQVKAFTDGEVWNELLLPPVADHQQTLPPAFLPTLRPLLLSFQGQVEGKSSNKVKQSRGGISPEWIKQQLATLQAAVTRNTADKFSLNASCSDASSFKASDREKRGNGAGSVDLGEWRLCDSAQDRAAMLSTSTFSLVVNSRSGKLGPSTYLRLVEGLRYGAVPVVVGIDRLPLDQIIDWNLAAIFVPPSNLGQLHYVLRQLDSDVVLRYRRQGRFLWETYFQSPSKMLAGVLAVVRWWAQHPPPPARDFKAPLTHLSRAGDLPPLPASTFQYNFTTYSWEFWNSPPGPHFMYPVTPFKPVPISGTQYVSLNKDQLTGLPSHVLAAGGITGPYFEDFLLGNIPEEQFTVLILTYERNQVLLDTVGRLANMDHLAKVLVVWNNPTPPPDSMKWPDIGVAVEVVGVSRNSLNNRFLPFTSIETEAVLSLDDDVHLRHDEIQFAFRVWREARDRIVGFPGRFHAWDARHPGWLYNSNYTCELSMVLTGAAFIHKYYMYLYSQWMPEAIRAMVDRYTNCEDIAMNFLVAHITRKPPLKVTSRWTFRCPGCPETLSSNNEHFNERHLCMNQLVAFYGYMPLLYTQFRLDSVLFKTRLPTNLEKCYEYI